MLRKSKIMRAKPLVYLLLFATIIMGACMKKGLKAAQKSDPIDKIETLSNEVASDGDGWEKGTWDDAADLLENALGNLPERLNNDEEVIVNSALSRMKVYADHHRRKASSLLDVITNFSPEEIEASAQPAAAQPVAAQPAAAKPAAAKPVAAPQAAPQPAAKPAAKPAAPAGLLSGSVIREGGYTNVRKGPGTNFAIVKKIKDGSPIYFTNYNNNWCVVYDNAGKMIGYMHASKVVGSAYSAPARSSSGLVADGTIFDWLATRYATENDIATHRHELRYLRNAIYARHYRKFKDANLRNYFNQFQWYDGRRDEIPASELNKYEKYNIQFIQKHE